MKWKLRRALENDFILRISTIRQFKQICLFIKMAGRNCSWDMRRCWLASGNISCMSPAVDCPGGVRQWDSDTVTLWRVSRCSQRINTGDTKLPPPGSSLPAHTCRMWQMKLSRIWVRWCWLVQVKQREGEGGGGREEVGGRGSLISSPVVRWYQATHTVRYRLFCVLSPHTPRQRHKAPVTRYKGRIKKRVPSLGLSWPDGSLSPDRFRWVSWRWESVSLTTPDCPKPPTVWKPRDQTGLIMFTSTVKLNMEN